MNKSTVLILVACFALGFLGLHAYNGTLPQLAQSVATSAQPIINTVQPIFTRIQTAWASIPQPLPGIILAGIPTLFMLFFAWTKNRAMQKLQQTQLQARAKLTQLSGEASDQAEQIKAQRLEIERLKNLNPNEQIKRLTDDLNKTEEVLHAKRIELAGKDQTIKTLESQLEKLRIKLVEAEAKLAPIP